VDKGAGSLMTFVQFLFVSVTFLPRFLSFRDESTGKYHLKLTNRAPMKDYAIMTAILFASTAASNESFALGVSQPFNMIFRSLSLLASYLLGVIAFGKKYSMRQLVAVVLVTIGVLITTLGEFALKSGIVEQLERCCSSQSPWSQLHFVWTHHGEFGLNVFSSTSAAAASSSTAEQVAYFFMTLVLMSVTLVGLAVLGHLQGKAYREYDCDAWENMYFLHLLPLPMFALLRGELQEHFHLWNASAPYQLFGIVTVPWIWWLCALNILTQLICLFGIHNTTASLGTLVCTFATTVRKFLSLLFSVLYFRSPFTSVHTVGAFCVFLGIYLFATAPQTDHKQQQKIKKE